jgi:hypothetical protein
LKSREWPRSREAPRAKRREGRPAASAVGVSGRRPGHRVQSRGRVRRGSAAWNRGRRTTGEAGSSPSCWGICT